MNWRFDIEKFINAVLFFAANSDAESFGVTKLIKQMYYSDFEHFKKYGKPIIGDRYIKLPNGPVPSTAYNIINGLLNSIDEVPLYKELAKKIEVKRGKYKNKTIHRIIALVKPDLDVFSKSELRIMKKVADVCKNKNLTASLLSKLTHTEGAPWSNTEDNQEIDYRLALDDSDESVSKKYVEYWNKETENFDEIIGSSPPYGVTAGVI